MLDAAWCCCCRWLLLLLLLLQLRMPACSWQLYNCKTIRVDAAQPSEKSGASPDIIVVSCCPIVALLLLPLQLATPAT